LGLGKQLQNSQHNQKVVDQKVRKNGESSISKNADLDAGKERPKHYIQR